MLLAVAWEVGGKWEEVGVSLRLDYKVLRNVVGSQIGVDDHMKAFRMLQEWKNRTPGYSFELLASSLEDSGLNQCAKNICYSKNKQ